MPAKSKQYMSKHEALFGGFSFCKDIKFYTGQVTLLLLSICIAWSLINFTSESFALIAMKGDDKFT
jgi:hypothetical protein